MKLIFIVGKKRSGKDTAVEFINEHFDVIDYKLAFPIKKALQIGWDGKAQNGFYSDYHRPFPLSWEDWDGNGIDREKIIPIGNREVGEILRAALNHLTYNHGLDGRHVPGSLIDDLILNNTEGWNIRRLMQTLGTDIVVNHYDRMFWVKLFALQYADKFEEDKKFFIVPDTRQDHELSFARAMGATVIHVVRDGSGSVDEHITEAGLPIAPGDIVIENNGTLTEFKQKIIEALND